MMYVISVVYLLECNWSRVLLMPVYCDLRHNDISPLFSIERERKKGRGSARVKQYFVIKPLILLDHVSEISSNSIRIVT